MAWRRPLALIGKVLQGWLLTFWVDVDQIHAKYGPAGGLGNPDGGAQVAVQKKAFWVSLAAPAAASNGCMLSSAARCIGTNTLPCSTTYRLPAQPPTGCSSLAAAAACTLVVVVCRLVKN